MAHVGGAVVVRITDRGSGVSSAVVTPDLEAKLRGDQSPRGWGWFLIEEMVDGVTAETVDGRHVVELTMRAEEAVDG